MRTATARRTSAKMGECNRFARAACIAIITAFAVLGAVGIARADGLPEICPANLSVPNAATAADTFAFVLLAPTARTVTAQLTIRTDKGWFSADVPSQKLQPVAVQRVFGGKLLPPYDIERSPILYVRFPSVVTIVEAWVSGASSDAPGWGDAGNVTCDPPQGTPVSKTPPTTAVLSPASLRAFTVTPGVRISTISVHPTMSLDMSCPKPFADARALKTISPSYPYSGAMPGAVALVEVLIGDDGRPLGTTMLRSSGDAAYDIAARIGAEKSTYSPAIAYCKPTVSRYIYEASFSPR